MFPAGSKWKIHKSIEMVKGPSRNELEEGGSLKSKVLRALMADLIYKFAILTLFVPGGPPLSQKELEPQPHPAPRYLGGHIADFPAVFF